MPLTIYLLALFFGTLNVPLSNGFLASQSLIFISEINLISNSYINYLFVFLIFILFLISFYFTVGLKLNEWNNIFQFIKKLTKICILFIFKLTYLIKFYLGKILNKKSNLKETINSKPRT